MERTLKGRVERIVRRYGVPRWVRILSAEVVGENLVLTVLDRPDKTALIGTGGRLAILLAEELGVKGVYVTTLIDLVTVKLRVSSALNKLKPLTRRLTGKAFHPLLLLERCLVRRLKDPVRWVGEVVANLESAHEEVVEGCCVGLSGGVDSLATTLILRSIGVKPLAVTVNPGSIILPPRQLSIIRDSCRVMGVKSEFLKPVKPEEFEENVKMALEGRRHPCKRCSELIKSSVIRRARESRICVVFFGSLLPTGGFSIEVLEGGLVVIHLPAALALTKGLTSYIVRSFLGDVKPYPYGCPLLTECNRRYKSMKLVTIKRLLKKVRAGVMEPAEAMRRLRFILYT